MQLQKQIKSWLMEEPPRITQILAVISLMFQTNWKMVKYTLYSIDIVFWILLIEFTNSDVILHIRSNFHYLATAFGSSIRASPPWGLAQPVCRIDC